MSAGKGRVRRVGTRLVGSAPAAPAPLLLDVQRDEDDEGSPLVDLVWDYGLPVALLVVLGLLAWYGLRWVFS